MAEPLSREQLREIDAEVAEKVMGIPARSIPEGENEFDCLTEGGPTWTAVVQAAIDAKVELRQSGTYKGTTYTATHDGWCLSTTSSDNYRASESIPLDGKPERWIDPWDGGLLVFPAKPEPYSTDANAAREMEAEVERRGLRSRYAAALIRIVAPEPLVCVASYDLFPLIHATPEQRCRAALAAMEQQGEPEGEVRGG